jgi:leader peptidase (prepilin peptidase)/N-methyltransferase
MMAMVGAFLGLPLTLLTILLGSVLGSIIGLAVIALTGKERHYELPFGTFLGGGAIVALLYGDDLIRVYFDYFFPTVS